MGARVITFGEIMLRLKSPGHERLLQSPFLEATFGGGEANVALSLAQFGLDVAFVTALPENTLGNACMGELRRWGVDTSKILLSGQRLGIYFLETGADQRPSKVVYDREESAFSRLCPGDLDWASILAGADWLHITGITPALGQNLADVSIEAFQEARKRGIMVSCDYNYRSKLWKYGKQAPEVMRQLLQHVDVGIANEEDCQKSLGIELNMDMATGHLQENKHRFLAQRVLEQFPLLKMQAVTFRESYSADHNGWAAVLHDRNNFYSSQKYQIHDIVDRVGGGDSFAAGLIYSLLTRNDPQWALDFATAASCLKHSISGDYNRIGIHEVEALMEGNGSGRIQR